jgi:class 3 adenylate cyclase/predicted ATPase
MVACTACGQQTPAGKKFCIHCGTARQAACAACGEQLIPGAKFCAECGTPVASNGAPTSPASPSRAVAAGAGALSPAAERRLVSVLFADLVGFTTLSEHRDPEEVRELLSRYFDRCRSLIERYGGTVEKFIGDAVMAVWGTPVAREDDAERSVRAALALTQAVTLLGEEVGMPELRVRAGVLTGQAAVELGAEGEGMVLGDTVNTASRLQSLAAPGTVLVDDVTKRGSEAAIAYEDAGVHQVKGREQPVHAWTALRVVAGARGNRRSAALEAPLVGRERELHTIIESFESTVAGDRARLVTVVGDAGAGKSRLLWEFEKYIDGIERVVRWHEGRCLAYGEGVAYWALAEMVRARAGILEEEDAATARAKLRETVIQFVPDEREQRLVEPRLAHLLGLEQRTAADRADLFSGWRLFFERIAADQPVAMAFEDLQWADSGLLDFIDYLLEWSAEYPIFILGLGRGELLTARPDWTPTITLDPLPEDTMGQLLAGLVPGLPDELATQIRRRAEGVPLYAVETVRMLLDRGLVAPEGNGYVVTGDVADLEVPETLQALIAARLDDLDAQERALVQDAAVIGTSFSPSTLAAISELPGKELDPVLRSLVAKQVLRYVDESLSAERGQYVFLQGLLRTVALATLSRRDRKAKHLAVARHLQEAWRDEAGDIAEVLASHYLAAVEADPEASDAGAIRARACATLEEAGRRAMSLALGPEARAHFERAAKLAEDSSTRARLLREAGTAAKMSGQLDDAQSLLSAAATLNREVGLVEDAAHAECLIGQVLMEAGRVEQAKEALDRAATALEASDDTQLLAELLAERALLGFNLGRPEEAVELADRALIMAERRQLWPVLVSALITKSIVFAEAGRPVESFALLEHATRVAVEHDLAGHAVRGYYNLADALMAAGRIREAADLLQRGLELARRRGDRQSERRVLAQNTIALVYLGRWDDAVETAYSLRTQADDVWAAQSFAFLPMILAARGETTALAQLPEAKSSQHGLDGAVAVANSAVLRETGRGAEATAGLREPVMETLGLGTCEVPLVFAEAVESATAAGGDGLIKEMVARVETMEPGQRMPMLDGEAQRAAGRLAAQRGDTTTAERAFQRAVDLLSEMEWPFGLARAQLEYAELLFAASDTGGVAARLRDEAARVFEQLRARPWLERAEALRSAVAA